jgi:hypothetical protein
MQTLTEFEVEEIRLKALRLLHWFGDDDWTDNDGERFPGYSICQDILRLLEGWSVMEVEDYKNCVYPRVLKIKGDEDESSK